MGGDNEAVGGREGHPEAAMTPGRAFCPRGGGESCPVPFQQRGKKCGVTSRHCVLKDQRWGQLCVWGGAS